MEVKPHVIEDAALAQGPNVQTATAGRGW